ncbi:hypothetical protein [Endozoicomonas sp.]|uniref:hypothetical protein n=1 Tax=Endozoicomonas sp. TaxID=1892382 RepID=UPI002886258D|nr:hypothetical protein [Endozoicomonas sp.]
MSDNLFKQLTDIGIDPELAGKVSASLDPEHNASKKDVLIMQEAMMQVQLVSESRYHEMNNKTDRSYHELNSKMDHNYHELNRKIDRGYHQLDQKIDTRYHELDHKIDTRCHELDTKIESLKTEMHQGFSGLRTEMASMNRQYLITFGGLITTIITVFLTNLYFHL